MTATLILDTPSHSPYSVAVWGYRLTTEGCKRLDDDSLQTPENAIADGWVLLGSPTLTDVATTAGIQGPLVRWTFQRAAVETEALDRLLEEVRATTGSLASAAPQEIGDRVGNAFFDWVNTMGAGNVTEGRRLVVGLMAALAAATLVAEEDVTDG